MINNGMNTLWPYICCSYITSCLKSQIPFLVSPEIQENFNCINTNHQVGSSLIEIWKMEI